MSGVSVLALRAAGINCERELCHAFTLAGAARVELVHVRRLAARPRLLDEFQILALPGGFSYGDDIAAGRILATELNAVLGAELTRFVARGGLMLGVCNGFQVLVSGGLLPGLAGDGNRVTAALADNVGGRFRDLWVPLDVTPSVSAWVPPGLAHLELPIAHGEGRFVVDDARLARLVAGRQIVFTYAAGHNPNGALADIAGICDPTGRILGLMPHPERHILRAQHPRWSREGTGRPDGEGEGLAIFRQGLASARAAR